MASSLDSLVGQNIMVVTTDGRCFHGTLKGFDQTINLILDAAHERVYSPEEGVELVPLGLYIIRGDSVITIGEVDEDIDSNIDFTSIKANPLPSIVRM